MVNNHTCYVLLKTKAHISTGLFVDSGSATNLDERGAAEEETKHVGHNVVTDHTGNWHNEPVQTNKSHARLNLTRWMKQNIW